MAYSCARQDDEHQTQQPPHDPTTGRSGRRTAAEARVVDDDLVLFAPFIHELEGGPRNLAGAVESIRLCAAQVRAQAEATNAFFVAR